MDAFFVRRRHWIAGSFAAAGLWTSGCASLSDNIANWRQNQYNGGQTPTEVKEQRSRSEAATTARSQAPSAPAGPITAPSGVAAPPSADVVPASVPSPEMGTTQIRVVALVGSDIAITDDEVWQMVRQRAPEYVKLAGATRGEKEREIFREELQRLIEREILLADFFQKIKKSKPQAIDELRDEVKRSAAKQLKEFRDINKIANDAEFSEMLKSQGMSIKILTRQLERNAMMSIYVQQYMKDKGKTISQTLVERFYAENQNLFKIDEKVKWLDLFVSFARFNTTVEARQYAEALWQQAQSGVDFVKLVKERGHGDSPLRDGEGVGTKKGEILPAELESTVLSLPAGQLSGLIATETGFHIVLVKERQTAGVKPFDEDTQARIRARLQQQMQKAEYERLIEELWRKTSVRIIEVP